MKKLFLLIFLVYSISAIAQPIKSLVGDERSVRTVSFSPDGSFLVSGEGNRFNKSGRICTWDTKTWKLLNKTEVDYSAQISFSPDGKYLGSMNYTEKADGDFYIWDFPSMNKKWNHLFVYNDYDNIVPTFAFSPSGESIVFLKESVASNIKLVSLAIYSFKTSVLTEDTLFKEKSDENDMVGYKIVQYAQNGKNIVFSANKYNIYVWDIENKKVLFKLKGKDELSAQFIALSPNSSKIAACNYSDDNLIYLWDVNSGQLLKTLQGHEKKVMCLVFSPDNKYLASCGRDKSIKLWDAETGKLITTLKDHTDDVNCVCYSPDGKFLVSASSDESVKVWDIISIINSNLK